MRKCIRVSRWRAPAAGFTRGKRRPRDGGDKAPLCVRAVVEPSLPDLTGDRGAHQGRESPLVAKPRAVGILEPANTAPMLPRATTPPGSPPALPALLPASSLTSHPSDICIFGYSLTTRICKKLPAGRGPVYLWCRYCRTALPHGEPAGRSIDEYCRSTWKLPPVDYGEGPCVGTRGYRLHGGRSMTYQYSGLINSIMTLVMPKLRRRKVMYMMYTWSGSSFT